ncbi:GNAT family N-acetyltransferase [Insolitispirillum peregrinum]|uniref:Predicted N-acetyltransferase YhbS n=1 Tax=Insolitispirillum peregrinum TaxID=80876 RepID=A0A1N7IK73_9PROT|nr:N-acetyltransferase [Insolitispirillum peregrinum]SIS37467.1 Predicted N-acetyltransferase YhbS [Insolitispirillum peregrinum]
MHVVNEAPHHADLIEDLLEVAFGPDRHQKTVYRLREGVAAIPGLSLVAETEDGEFRGTLRFWPVHIRTATGKMEKILLLGPIAVESGLRNTGVGTLLMTEGLARAKAMGWDAVLLVGDEPYYSRFGFKRSLAEGLQLPGPVDVNRFLGLELKDGVLNSVSGMVEPAVPAYGASV